MKRALAVMSLIIILGLSGQAQQKPPVWFEGNRPGNHLDQQLAEVMTRKLNGRFTLVREKKEALFKLFVQAHRGKNEKKVTAELYVMLMLNAGKAGHSFPVMWRYIREADTLEQVARRLSQAFSHDAKRLTRLFSTESQPDQRLADTLGKRLR